MGAWFSFGRSFETDGLSPCIPRRSLQRWRCLSRSFSSRHMQLIVGCHRQGCCAYRSHRCLVNRWPARLGAPEPGRTVRLMQTAFGVMASSRDLARRRWSLRSTRPVCGGSRRRLRRVHCIVTSSGSGDVWTNGMATILGATYTGAGIGGLIRPPLAGAIIDTSSFNAGITYALITAGVSAFIIYTLPVT